MTKTPMMQQWTACKEAAPDSLLLFRLGDFYECFHDDAAKAAEALGLTLTSRQGIPMAGIPYHAAEGYIDRLVKGGIRVAIAEQTEDPKKSKGIVKREVVRTVSRGTLVDSELLDGKRNNYFCAACKSGMRFAAAFLDITTADFFCNEFSGESAFLDAVHAAKPSEIVTSKSFENQCRALLLELKNSFSPLIRSVEDWRFDASSAEHRLSTQLGDTSLAGFGLNEMPLATLAAATLVTMLKDELNIPLGPVKSIRLLSSDKAMGIDRNTLKMLELTEPLYRGRENNALISIIDHTETAMGGRLLYQWLAAPLLSIPEITQRQKLSLELAASNAWSQIRQNLANIQDLERLATKIQNLNASPKDLFAILCSLQALPELRQILPDSFDDYPLNPLPELKDLLKKALNPEPPLKVGEGKVFKEDYHSGLGELLGISRNSKAWLRSYQERLKEELGIRSLKVGYTRVFGYYVEVSRQQAENMPEGFVRRQSLANGERFLTDELKEFEGKVLSAEEKIQELEQALFKELVEKVASYSPSLLQNAKTIAEIDALFSLSNLAKKRGYCRPEIVEGRELSIVKGRHPVIDSAHFTPNDCILDEGVLIITGPNMAGKSTYIRQTALLVILAQMGACIPAKSAKIGIVDKLFARIGASDDLARGQSTFMVEMVETANILNNATDRSLVILDEIGRGTSTYDGIAIAWAVTEYLLIKKRAKTLFATHYFELTEMEKQYAGIKNANVAVDDSSDEIRFLHRIEKGPADRSYGVHVGKLAGLPEETTKRAWEILEKLEKKKGPAKALVGTRVKHGSDEFQLMLFEPQKKKTHPAIKKLKTLEVNKLTPLEALEKLQEMQALL